MSDTNRVPAILRRNGITQVALAAELDLSQAAVSDRYRGRTPWRVAELCTIAAITGATIDELAGSAA